MNRIKQIMLKLAGLEGSTPHISLSFAIGVFIGFSPFLGMHTMIALALCFITRLNKPALLIGNFLNMPWILVPYYTFATWIGSRLLGIPGRSFPPDMTLSRVFSVEFMEWIISQWVLLIPAFVGSTILAGLLALIAYKTASFFLNRLRSSSLKMSETQDA